MVQASGASHATDTKGTDTTSRARPQRGISPRTADSPSGVAQQFTAHGGLAPCGVAQQPELNADDGGHQRDQDGDLGGGQPPVV